MTAKFPPGAKWVSGISTHRNEQTKKNRFDREGVRKSAEAEKIRSTLEKFILRDSEAMK